MKKSNKKKIAAHDFDRKFDKREDISDYLNFEDAVVVKRINVDMPQWLLDELDREALKLNVSRQAIIKIWLSEKVEDISECGGKSRKLTNQISIS